MVEPHFLHVSLTGFSGVGLKSLISAFSRILFHFPHLLHFAQTSKGRVPSKKSQLTPIFVPLFIVLSEKDTLCRVFRPLSKEPSGHSSETSRNNSMHEGHCFRLAFFFFVLSTSIVRVPSAAASFPHLGHFPSANFSPTIITFRGPYPSCQI